MDFQGYETQIQILLAAVVLFLIHAVDLTFTKYKTMGTTLFKSTNQNVDYKYKFIVNFSKKYNKPKS